MAEPLISVIDVETTGFGHQDRIIEFAVVQMTLTGKPISEFVTLINPERHVGATGIHGIEQSHVENAPRFEEVAADILGYLENTIWAGHNFNFDERFIRQEYERHDYDLPEVPTICTMQNAEAIGFGYGERKLNVICKTLGIDTGQQHSALDDARATAAILSLILERGGFNGEDYNRLIPPFPQHQFVVSSRYKLRPPPPEDAPPLSRISELLINEPIIGQSDSEAQNEYLIVLDKALGDRRMENREFAELFVLARERRIKAGELYELHEAYFASLISKAWEDGKVTSVEFEDLQKVGRLLGFNEDHISILINDRRYSEPVTISGLADENFTGKTVCFTGALNALVNGKPLTKANAHELAESCGLVPVKAVSKKLDVLVVADPFSASGKAKKAREYGTHIMGEDTFWKRLGFEVD